MGVIVVAPSLQGPAVAQGIPLGVETAINDISITLDVPHDRVILIASGAFIASVAANYTWRIRRDPGNVQIILSPTHVVPLNSYHGPTLVAVDSPPLGQAIYRVTLLSSGAPSIPINALTLTAIDLELIT